MMGPASAPQRPGRILIVDDERVNVSLLEVMLEEEGFTIFTARNGEEALATTERDHPDVILLDVMMPQMDGYTVLRRLKANDATSNIPVIMITALDDREAKMLGLNAGAEDFLSRPVDRAELRARVRNLLRLKAFSDYHRKHGEVLEGEVSSRNAELVESEKRYRQIVESTSDGIVKLGVDGAITFTNQRFADMLGYSVAELLGESATSIAASGSAALMSQALERRREGHAETYNVPVRRRDGTELTVNLATTPIFDETGAYAGALASARDVTDQLKLLAQLTVSDRMASIGTLAAGVAHEINNPLACVMANIDMAAEDVESRGQAHDLTAELRDVRAELEDAREAAGRIRSIVRDLKLFSRSEDDKTGAVDVHRVLESTLRMAWNEIRHRARLVKAYRKTPPVEASEARLGQVFLNLIVNAAQAMEEGHAEENEIRVSTEVDASGRVVVIIADTGAGMPPDVMSRLFTPFFTTKPVGVGTGLGLSICHRIITSFDGTIEVKSDVGRGTTIRVALPVARNELVSDSGARALDIAATRHGRVLVVDDEPMVARTVQRALLAAHEVVAVSTAADALARIDSGERFDAILCDLMMPVMTGMDLHTEIERRDADEAKRMIFLTGGAFTPRARAFLDAIPNQRVDKPFDVRHLRALINDRIR